MKTVAQSTDYYNRLLKKLDEQETSIEKLQKESVDLQQKLDQQRKALQDYLANLNVG
jgi:predicted solute-binding protein